MVNRCPSNSLVAMTGRGFAVDWWCLDAAHDGYLMGMTDGRWGRIGLVIQGYLMYGDNKSRQLGKTSRSLLPNLPRYDIMEYVPIVATVSLYGTLNFFVSVCQSSSRGDMHMRAGTSSNCIQLLNREDGASLLLPPPNPSPTSCSTFRPVQY
jgi:hypothetical protein